MPVFVPDSSSLNASQQFKASLLNFLICLSLVIATSEKRHHIAKPSQWHINQSKLSSQSPLFQPIFPLLSGLLWTWLTAVWPVSIQTMPHNLVPSGLCYARNAPRDFQTFTEFINRIYQQLHPDQRTSLLHLLLAASTPPSACTGPKRSETKKPAMRDANQKAKPTVTCCNIL